MQTTAHAVLVDTAAMRFAARRTIVRRRRCGVRITAATSREYVGALAHNAAIVDQQHDALHGVAALRGVGEVLSIELRAPDQRSLAFDLKVVGVQRDALNNLKEI